MPFDANCPRCNHVFPVAEARHTVGVTCPGCDADLTAEFRKLTGPAVPGQPQYELLVSHGRPPGLAPALAAGEKKLRLDDEEEAKTRGGGSMTVVVVSGITAFLIALGGLGVVGYYLFNNLDTSDSTASRASSNATRPGTNAPNNSNRTGPNRPGPNFLGPNIPDLGPGVPIEPPKKVDTFDLRPVSANPPAISPPASVDAANPKTILLPGRAGAVAVGGGGRFIVMHFPQQGQLAVFDANAGDLTTSQTIPEGELQMAAGADLLLVTVPRDRNKLRSYTLPELQQVKEFEYPLFHGSRSIAMGSRTSGPLLMVDPFGELALMNVQTGKPIEGATNKQVEVANSQLRASADGQLFLAGNGYGQDDKFQLVDEFGKKWRVRNPDLIAGYLGSDGKHLFGKDQIMTAAGGQVAGKGDAAGNVWYVPAVTATGEHYLKVADAMIGSPPRQKKGVSVAVHKGVKNVDRPVLTAWAGLPETDNLIGPFGNTEVLDRHLFLIPEAKLLVILNRDKTKLVVRKIAI